MSVLMTLSDHERWDVREWSNFSGWFLHLGRSTVWLRMKKFGMCNICGNRRVSRGQPRPIPRGGVPAFPKFLGTPSIHRHG